MNTQPLGAAYSAQLTQLANRQKLLQRETEERVIREAVAQALKK